MGDRERLTWTIYDSPVGPLTLVAGPEGIRNIRFPGRTAPPAGGRQGPDAGARRPARRLLRG